jgi:hypothetical protein
MKKYLALNETLRHEDVWGSGGVAPRILNLGTRGSEWPLYPWKRYGIDDWSSIPCRGKNFSLHHHLQTSSGDHPASYPKDTKG